MSGVNRHGDFHGKRVLVIESELLVPFTLYRAMEKLGAEVVGPVVFPEDVANSWSGTPVSTARYWTAGWMAGTGMRSIGYCASSTSHSSKHADA